MTTSMCTKAEQLKEVRAGDAMIDYRYHSPCRALLSAVDNNLPGSKCTLTRTSHLLITGTATLSLHFPVPKSPDRWKSRLAFGVPEIVDPRFVRAATGTKSGAEDP